MATADLDWFKLDIAEIFLLIQAVSEQGGVCSLMFGGYGKYYKISWSIGGENGFISGETEKRMGVRIREQNETGVGVR